MSDHELMLRQLLADVAEQYYEGAAIAIQPTSSGGGNYTSVLYNITISAPNKKPLHLFAKVANMNEKTREVLPTFIFDTERFIYRDLADTFRRIEQKCGVPEEHRYVLPKFYGYNSNVYEETIVMEDLAAQGYIVYDRFKSIDWPYASKAVETLAKFHALSIAYAEEYPKEFDKLCKELTGHMDVAVTEMSNNFKHFIETALSVIREENKDRLQKFFDKLLEGGNVFRYTKAKLRPVLIHGDYRPSNIMHRVNEDGSVDLIPLDYQTIQAGCGITDLLYFIFSGSDGEFRASHYRPLVDHYYRSLAQALTRLQLNPDKIYPREDFESELQETLPHGLVSALLLLPLVTVEAEDAPDVNGAAIWESMAKPKTGSCFASRMNDVIDDYIRWGVL